jgi:KaiC/GvpD/RAD55 family RecA-like ATPase
MDEDLEFLMAAAGNGGNWGGNYVNQQRDNLSRPVAARQAATSGERKNARGGRARGRPSSDRMGPPPQTEDDEDQRRISPDDIFTALVVGRSNSGKTSLVKLLARRYAKKYSKDIYIVNERPEARSGFKRVDWDTVESVRDAVIIIDDLVGASTEELTILRKLLTVHNHHYRCNPLFICSHSITKTGCRSLMHHISRIYIAATQCSFRTLADTLNFYAFEQMEKDEVYARLKAGKFKPFTFFYIDIDNRTIKTVNMGKEALEEVESNKRRENEEVEQKKSEMLKTAGEMYASILPDDSSREKASIITEIVLGRMLGSVDPLDLSIKSRSGGRESAVSLVDYVATLVMPELSESLESHTMRELHCLHRYLAHNRGVVIPAVLISNKSFRKAAEAKQTTASAVRVDELPVPSST